MIHYSEDISARMIIVELETREYQYHDAFLNHELVCTLF
jgi:hypothetical protein